VRLLNVGVVDNATAQAAAVQLLLIAAAATPAATPTAASAAVLLPHVSQPPAADEFTITFHD
jgi:hypothetical protein